MKSGQDDLAGGADLVAFWIMKKNVESSPLTKTSKQVKTMANANHDISGPYSSIVMPKSASNSYL